MVILNTLLLRHTTHFKRYKQGIKRSQKLRKPFIYKNFFICPICYHDIRIEHVTSLKTSYFQHSLYFSTFQFSISTVYLAWHSSGKSRLDVEPHITSKKLAVVCTLNGHLRCHFTLWSEIYLLKISKPRKKAGRNCPKYLPQISYTLKRADWNRSKYLPKISHPLTGQLTLK